MSNAINTKAAVSAANPVSASTPEKNVEVLYQKMGNRWFAFSVVEGEVFMGSITQEEIDALEARSTFQISGNT